MKGGFKESPLRLNEGLGAIDTWNEAAIQERADRLAAVAVGVWAPPHLTSEVLDAYKPKSEKASSLYSIEDHMHLAAGTRSRELFDALRGASCP